MGSQLYWPLGMQEHCWGLFRLLGRGLEPSLGRLSCNHQSHQPVQEGWSVCVRLGKAWRPQSHWLPQENRHTPYITSQKNGHSMEAMSLPHKKQYTAMEWAVLSTQHTHMDKNSNVLLTHTPTHPHTIERHPSSFTHPHIMGRRRMSISPGAGGEVSESGCERSVPAVSLRLSGTQTPTAQTGPWPHPTD